MFEEVFTIGALFSLVGGALGGLFTVSKQHDGFWSSLITVAISISSGASVADYLNLQSNAWLALIVGIISGILAPRVLSVIDAMAPDLLPRLIDKIANTWLGRNDDK